MTKYGVLGGWRVGTGIALLPTHPPYPTPGTPSPSTGILHHADGHVPASNMAVGLISVGQLTLEALFSVFRGITEVYNLATVGRINNHFLISGNE